MPSFKKKLNPVLQNFASYVLQHWEEINFEELLAVNYRLKTKVKASSFKSYAHDYLEFILNSDENASKLNYYFHRKEDIPEPEGKQSLLSTIKILLLKLLPKYSSEPDQIAALAIEIELLDQEIRKQLFNYEQPEVSYEDLQQHKEDLQKANATLQTLNDKLAERNHYIEKITQAIPNTIYIFDLVHFKLVYTNQDIFKKLGYTDEQLYSKDSLVVNELIHPDDLEARLEFYNSFRTAKDKEVKTVEFRLLNAFGLYQTYLVRGIVFRRNELGVPTQMLGISFDVTEIRKTEAQLRHALQELTKSNQHLDEQKHFIEKAFHSTPHPIYILDIEKLKTVFINHNIVASLGYTDKEVYKMSKEELQKLIPPEDNEKRIHFYKNFVHANDEEVREVEFSMMSKNNGLRNLLVSATVFRRNSKGIPDQVIGMATDITKLRQTEEELRQSLKMLSNANEEMERVEDMLRRLNNELEYRVKRRTKELAESIERFELVAKATNDAVYDWMVGSENVWWNPSFEHLFGYTSLEEKEHPTLRSIMNRIHPEDVQEFQNLLDQSFSKEIENWHTKYRFRRADNTYAYVLVRGFILFNEEKEPYRMAGSMVDISDLREAQQTLQKKNEELKKINTDLDNFIYAASHDLMHPVTNLEGLTKHLNIILQKRLDEEEGKWMKMLETSVQRLKKVILDIGEVSKVQRNLDDSFQLVEMQAMFDEVKVELAQLIVKSDAVIRTDFNVSTFYYGLKNLKRVLHKLISNALKYRSLERKTEIVIKTFVEDDFVVLQVEDNGLGLKPAQAERLFTMFKRFHAHIEGSGIGLYMVKRIVENNGGKIIVHSEYNKGTTFKVFLTKVNEKV